MHRRYQCSICKWWKVLFFSNISNLLIAYNDRTRLMGGAATQVGPKAVKLRVILCLDIMRSNILALTFTQANIFIVNEICSLYVLYSKNFVWIVLLEHKHTWSDSHSHLVNKLARLFPAWLASQRHRLQFLYHLFLIQCHYVFDIERNFMIYWFKFIDLILFLIQVYGWKNIHCQWPIIIVKYYSSTLLLKT